MKGALSSLLEFRPDHAAWPIPGNIQEKLAEEDLKQYLKARKLRIERAISDPLRYGYIPNIWRVANQQVEDLRAKYPNGVIKLIIWGGHRSSKTRYAANFVNHEIKRTEGSRVWCCDSTEMQSRFNQMRLIWEQFPPEWRNLERDQITDIRYNESDGFPKNIITCPNKSQVVFKFYSMDVSSLPGPELSLVWCDELVPLEWVKFLVFRLTNRNGILLITFTPEFGYSPTFGHFYEGAQIIDQVDAPLLPRYDNRGRMLGYEQVPRVMQCSDPLARIVFFHTSDNPFGGYKTLAHELKSNGSNKEEILIRAYGLATKSNRVAFPMFSRRTHVITQNQFNKIVEEYPKGLRYNLVDPADGRNWFLCWIFCPRLDWWIVYREWPSHSHPGAYIKGVGLLGPWATSGAAADGVRGPAQDTLGFSLERYKEEIEDKETNEDGVREEIFARYIDSRYATQPHTQREGVTTLHEQLGEVGIDFLCMVSEARILGSKDGSIDLINSALRYDPEIPLGKWDATRGRLNMPQLQVTEQCPNTIYSLEHWTGIDGGKGACKDPLDVLRGAFLSGINYVDESLHVFTGGGVPPR